MVTFKTAQIQPNEKSGKTQNFRRRNSRTLKNIQPRIKLAFLYDSELEIQHIIYQNDEKKTYYNMESSKQSLKIIYEKSSLEIL